MKVRRHERVMNEGIDLERNLERNLEGKRIRRRRHMNQSENQEHSTHTRDLVVDVDVDDIRADTNM